MKPDGTTRRHVIERVVYREERIECTCSAVITAPADRSKVDRHGPLVSAWELHKREAGVRRGTGTGKWSRGPGRLVGAA